MPLKIVYLLAGAGLRRCAHISSPPCNQLITTRSSRSAGSAGVDHVIEVPDPAHAIGALGNRKPASDQVTCQRCASDGSCGRPVWDPGAEFVQRLLERVPDVVRIITYSASGHKAERGRVVSLGQQLGCQPWHVLGEARPEPEVDSDFTGQHSPIMPHPTIHLTSESRTALDVALPYVRQICPSPSAPVAANEYALSQVWSDDPGGITLVEDR